MSCSDQIRITLATAGSKLWSINKYLIVYMVMLHDKQTPSTTHPYPTIHNTCTWHEGGTRVTQSDRKKGRTHTANMMASPSKLDRRRGIKEHIRYRIAGLNRGFMGKGVAHSERVSHS